jgi:hypothetical protein
VTPKSHYFFTFFTSTHLRPPHLTCALKMSLFIHFLLPQPTCDEYISLVTLKSHYFFTFFHLNPLVTSTSHISLVILKSHYFFTFLTSTHLCPLHLTSHLKMYVFIHFLLPQPTYDDYISLVTLKSQNFSWKNVQISLPTLIVALEKFAFIAGRHKRVKLDFRKNLDLQYCI